MKLFNKGLQELILTFLLPIFLAFSLFIFLLGTVYFWSFLFFFWGCHFSTMTFRFVAYKAQWLKWIRNLNFGGRKLSFLSFNLLALSFVALLVAMLCYFFSTPFCLSVFGAYLTLSWIAYRLVSSNLILYTRLLANDHFKSTYWFIIPYSEQKKWPVPLTLKKIIRGLTLHRRASTEHQIEAIDMLLKRKYYASILDLQKKLLRYFDLKKLGVSVQERILLSFTQIPYQQFPYEKEWALFYGGGIRVTRLQTLLDLDFLQRWYEYSLKHPIHQFLMLQFFQYMGEELSKFIANPNALFFEGDTFDLLQNALVERQSKHLITQLPLAEDSDLNFEIKYVYNLVLISHGIAKNLE